MKAKYLAPIAAILIAGVAAADEPFVLDASAMDAVTAAGTFTYDAAATVGVTVNYASTVNVSHTAAQDLQLVGLTAYADAFADARGSQFAITETNSFAQVDYTSLISESGSTSFAGALPPLPIAQE
jgi:hypothetical protein